MRTISIINPKGGCGKSTIATSLAAALAWEGYQVALADMDPQQSTTDWLQQRPDDQPEIIGLSIDGPGQVRAPRGTDFMILDAPAATYSADLATLIRRSDTMLVPVLPSPIDMRAAHRFLTNLFTLKPVKEGEVKVGLIANRVRRGSVMYRELKGFLGYMSVPFVGHLRQSSNYVEAMERGLGVGDLPGSRAEEDWQEWETVLAWLRSGDSQPRSV